MTKNRITCLLLSLVLGLFSIAYSQSLEQAKRFFKEAKYAEAKPVFEKYVRKSKRNALYNYWYGACCVETGEKQKSISYLKFAVKRRVKEAYRYLGDVYYHFYRFEEAVDQYQGYIKIKRNERIKELYTEKIEKIQEQAKLLERVNEVQIIDSIVVPYSKWYATYKSLSMDYNTISLLTDYFETKGKLQNVPMFINARKNRRYFPYAKDGVNQDLYVQELIGEKWSTRKTLPLTINTPKNEGYPYVLNDGITFYFSSEGHNSIGGYDIFVTRYDVENNAFFEPQNLGMPFNSTANDYMYSVDESHHIGWFVTDRFQPKDTVVIYTFIPNDMVEIAEDKTIEEKRDLARITSIKKTWKQEDYTELLSGIYKEKRNWYKEYKEKLSQEFVFQIDADLIYTKLDDFQSIEGKGYFLQYENKREELKLLEQKLKKSRLLYAKEKNKTKKQKLTSQILTFERKYLQLVNEPKKLATLSRNAEKKKLQKK